jgi:hypothetical protein
MDVAHRWHVMDLGLVTVQWLDTAPLNSAAQRASISPYTQQQQQQQQGK